MSDNGLGPVEVEFVIPADFGKQADAAIKKMAGLTDAAKKMPEEVKAALLEEKDIIKTIEADIKQLEKTLQNVSPGKAKQSILADLGAAKRALEEEKAALKGLETQSDSTSQGSKRLTYVLRDMQDQLTKMRVAGQQNTQEYRNMELAAAKLSDELRDVRSVTKNMGDDQRTFKGMADGITGIAGAASAAVGGVALFAGENENLQRIQTRVQALMAITIGLQQVSSALDKDSAFMTVTVVKAKQMWTAAETRLTAALWGSNAAAKALMITATFGLAVAIPLLIGWYERLNQKQADAAAAQKEAMRVTTDANIEAGKSRIELELTIKKLEDFKGSKEAEKRMIEETNKKYGDSFGQYKTLATWLDVLKTKSSDYVQVMFLQAKAQGMIANAIKFDGQAQEVNAKPLTDYIDAADIDKNTNYFGKTNEAALKALAQKRKNTELNNANARQELAMKQAEGIQADLMKLQNSSGINASYPEKPVKSPKANADKSAKAEEESSYYLDLIDQFRSYQKKREILTNEWNQKIQDLNDVHHEEEAQNAVIARDKELKALDDAQQLNQMLEKYKTYDDQIKDIRTKSDAEILQLKEKGYNEQALLAGQMAAKEIEIIETEKLKSLEAFKGLFEDAGSQTADQIKSIIDEANQNLADLNPEELVIATAQIEKLGKKLDDLGAKGDKKEITDPFLKLSDAIKKMNSAAEDDNGDALVNGIKAAAVAANELLGDLGGVVDIMTDLGIISKDQGDAAKETFNQISGVVNGAANIATGIIDGDPAAIIKGAIAVVGNAIKLLDVRGKRIAKAQEEVTKEIGNMERAYKALDKAVQDSLGEDKYALQAKQYKLNIDEMAKYQELIDLESKKKKKKRDQAAIDEWKDAIAELEGANIDIENAITESLAQTNARDFASQIGDSIVAAFDAGTDASIAWGEVTNQVMRNAVINALKLKYLEKPIQEAVDAIAAGLKDDSYLSADEVAAIRKIVDEPAALMNQALQTMPDLFGTDPASSTDSPAKKASFTSMKEETGSALLGQFTALRMSNAIMADIAREEQYVRKSMNQALQAIAENTSYCRKLDNIDRTLKTIETDGLKVR